MNALKLIILAIVLLVLSEINSWSVLENLFLLLVGLLIVSFLWSRLSLTGLRVTREMRNNRAQVGESLQERVRIQNLSRFPKLWVELIDHSSLPGHQVSRVVHLSSNDSNRWKSETWCSRRGRFQLGPMTLRSGDPFGIFPVEQAVGGQSEIIVYPAVLDLGRFRLPEGDLPGGSAIQRRSPFVTPNASGIRQYSPGDALNRISWTATARTGQLMVKEFELDPTADLWMILDMDESRHRRASMSYAMQSRAMLGSAQGHIPVEHWLDSTDDYAVTVAASMGHHFLEQTRNVGLIANNQRHSTLLADRGGRQLSKLLELLAVVEADGRVPLAETLLSESQRFNRNSTVVVITSSTDEEWVQSLMNLMARGVRCAAVVIEPSTFDGGESSLMVISELTAIGVSTYLVKHGDDIAQALATQGYRSMTGSYSGSSDS